MASQTFRPNSFGVFLDTVRAGSSAGSTAIKSETAGDWVRVLACFGDSDEREVSDWQRASGLDEGDFALALSELKSRGFVAFELTMAKLTGRGRDARALLK